MPLRDRFHDTVERNNLLSRGDSVVVAVSGGIDSITLLHFLRFSANELELQLQVAHFDHRMRPHSAADGNWLRGVCRAWEVPLHIGIADPIPASEASARAARYQFLEGVATSIGADRIATAHHADDQAETVLFRLRRGTGLEGLSGIAARRGRIVRPLLGASRKEIEAFATRHGVRYREDLTNRSREYARNRIRLDLLPRLSAETPGLRDSLTRLAETAAGFRTRWQRRLDAIEERVIISQDAAIISLARPTLLEYHPEIRARLLRRCLGRLGSMPGRAGTGTLQTFINSSESGSTLHLKGGLRAERDFDTIRLSRVEHAGTGSDQALSIDAETAGSGNATMGGTRWTVDWSMTNGAATENSVLLDPAALRFPLVVRRWQPGDRIRLAVGSKKLKKLFAERRWGRARRHRVPVLVDRNEEVLWVAGLAHAAGVSCDGYGLRITVSDGQLD